MLVAFLRHISLDAKRSTNIINILSEKAKAFFNNREYGPGITSFYIGMICVNPQNDLHQKLGKPKYNKKTKVLEYDLKLDYKQFMHATDLERKEILAEKVINSLASIEQLKIKDFDLESFKRDLTVFFRDVSIEDVEITDDAPEEPSDQLPEEPSFRPDFSLFFQGSEKNKTQAEQILNINDEVILQLKELKKQKKFGPEGLYPGAVSERSRLKLQRKIDTLLEHLILEIKDNPKKSFVLSKFKSVMEQSLDCDTEDKEMICAYLGKIMEILQIQSSDGLLNSWLYGFDV